jgi:hypothetical protein
MTSSFSPTGQLSRASVIAWCVAIVGTLILAIRLVWEQTLLTWERGEQMVGFSMAHTWGVLLLIVVLCLLCAHAWILAFIIEAIYRAMRKRPIARSSWVAAVLLSVAVGLIYVPYSAWKYLIVTLKGPGPQAESLLKYAIVGGNRRLAELLIVKGTSLDGCDAGDIETEAMMVRGGASDYTFDGCAPLSVAARVGSPQGLQLLLSKGANPNVRSGHWQRTPLMDAAQANRPEAVKALLRAGADPGLRDTNGYTALDIARSKGFTRVTSILQRD